MAKSSDSLPWAIALLLTGGFLSRPLIEQKPQNIESTAATARESPCERRNPKSAKAHAEETASGAVAMDHKDAIDVVAEHFGIDISAEALGDRAHVKGGAGADDPFAGQALRSTNSAAGC